MVACFRQTSSSESISSSSRVAMMLILTLVCRCNSTAVASSSSRHSHDDSTSAINRRPTVSLPVHIEDDHVTSNDQSASRRPRDDDDDDDDEQEEDSGPEVTSFHGGETVVATRIQDKRHHGAEASSPSGQDIVGGLRDGPVVASDSRLRSSMQAQQPRWSRSGVTRVIIYDRPSANHGNEEESATDEATPTKSLNLTEDTWRKRMRSKQLRIFNILKDVHDYIGPQGRHRAALSTTTPAAASAATRCPTATAKKTRDMRPQQGRPSDDDTADGRPIVGQTTGGLRHRGPHGRTQQPVADECHTVDDDDTQNKASASTSPVIVDDVRRDVLIVTSSCGRKSVDSHASSNASAHQHVDDGPTDTGGSSPSRKKNRSSLKDGRASGSGLWIEFELKPSTHCCYATTSRRRNGTSTTVSTRNTVSTRLALYKKARVDTNTRSLAAVTHRSAMTSRSRNTSGHVAQGDRRMTSQHPGEHDDVNSDTVRLEVFQRRVGHNNGDALKLIGSHLVDRKFEGWTILELTPDNDAAKAIEDQCRRAASGRHSRRGGVSKANRVTTDLLVRATGHDGVVSDDRAEVDDGELSHGSRRRQRRRRTKELNVHDLFRVPADCGSSDELPADSSSSSSVVGRSRRSSNGKHRRVDDHGWSCGSEDGTTRRHPVTETSVPRSKRPFIELTWSTAVGVNKSARNPVRGRSASDS